MDAALAALAERPVEEMTIKQYVAERAELFDRLFAQGRTPDEVANFLETHQNGLVSDQAAELVNLAFADYRSRSATDQNRVADRKPVSTKFRQKVTPAQLDIGELDIAGTRQPQQPSPVVSALDPKPSNDHTAVNDMAGPRHPVLGRPKPAPDNAMPQAGSSDAEKRLTSTLDPPYRRAAQGLHQGEPANALSAGDAPATTSRLASTLLPNDQTPDAPLHSA